MIGDKLKYIGQGLLEFSDDMQAIEEQLMVCQDRITILENEADRNKRMLKIIASAIMDELGG